MPVAYGTSLIIDKSQYQFTAFVNVQPSIIPQL